MKNFTPQDPAPWAEKILALKNAIPFQAFTIVMVSDSEIPVLRPDSVEITGSCADVKLPRNSRQILALEWVLDIEIGSKVEEAPRSPRYAAKLRALQADGPKGPLLIALQDGRLFTLAGTHEFLVSPDGHSVAVCDQDGGLVILETSEITDLAPRD